MTGPEPAAPASPVGLIAGSGGLPVEIARGAHQLGRSVICVDVFQADPQLPRIADVYYAVALGELSGMIEAFHRHGVREVLLAGKVDKLTALRGLRLDLHGMEVARRAADRLDASILGALTATLEDAGFEVASQARYVSHLVPPPGVLGGRPPSPDEAADIRLGARIARGTAALDVGQAVAIRRGVVVAVEASEGTDAMIRRAGALAHGIVVVKVSRPRQDPRYDLPVIGPETASALIESRGTALAVEAGRTILLDRERLITIADGAGLAVVSVELGE